MNRPVNFAEHDVSSGRIALRSSDVHLWRIPLEESAETVEALYQLLAPDEQERADRFVKPYLRRRFAVGRGRQRQILSAYVDAAPETLDYRYGPLGKPSLADQCNPLSIQFNLTNSHELALLAVVKDVEIGVDVEHVREVRDMDLARRFFAESEVDELMQLDMDLARRFFAESEVDELMQLDEDDRAVAFFNGWTRKEALLKAIGTGLSFPLTDVIVTMSPAKSCQLIRFDYESDSDVAWWLHALQPETGYVAAIAAQIATPSVSCFRQAGC